MERVKSKNLFNYKLNGVVDEYVAGMTSKRMEVMEKYPAMKEMFLRANSDDPSVDDEEAAKFLRTSMGHLMQMLDEAFKDVVDQCNHTDFKVPKRDGNDCEVPVLVHTPKSIADKTGRAAIIYAHGGGVVAGTAEQMRGPLSLYC